MKAVKEGRWFSTVVYVPFTQGKVTAALVINALRGKKIVNQSVNILKYSPVGVAVTKANAAKFTAEWSG